MTQTQEQGRERGFTLGLDDVLQLVEPSRKHIYWKKFIEETPESQGVFEGEVHEDPYIKVELSQSHCKVYAKLDLGFYFGERMTSRTPILAEYEDNKFGRVYKILEKRLDDSEDGEIVNHAETIKKLVGRKLR